MLVAQTDIKTNLLRSKQQPVKGFSIEVVLSFQRFNCSEPVLPGLNSISTFN
jgi:hypothetical protein